MKRRTALLLVAGLVVASAAVVPASETAVVTGHTTFADMAGLDPCLGAVAGLVQKDVLWFDDSFLHRRTNFEDEMYVFASEEEADDPTNHVEFENVSNIEENADDQPADKVLVRSGVWYNFTDPNDVHWNVTEVFWDSYRGAEAPHEVNGDSDGDDPNEKVSAAARTNRHYAWIVEIGPTTEDPYLATHDVFGGGDHYNFVNMVNTCKFSGEAEPEQNRTHDANNETIEGFEHENGSAHDRWHQHEAWTVKLTIDEEPDLVPLDAEPKNGVFSENVVDMMNNYG